MEQRNTSSSFQFASLTEILNFIKANYERNLLNYVPHVLCVLRALVPHMPRNIRTLMLGVPRTSCLLVPHVSYVLLYLTCLVPLRFLVLLVPLRMCSFAPHPSLASIILSLIHSYACHTLQLSCSAALLLLVFELFQFFTVNVNHCDIPLLKRNAITIVFCISNISLHDLLTSPH